MEGRPQEARRRKSLIEPREKDTWEPMEESPKSLKGTKNVIIQKAMLCSGGWNVAVGERTPNGASKPHGISNHLNPFAPCHVAQQSGTAQKVWQPVPICSPSE